MSQPLYRQQQPLDEEERDRLWEHGMHAENVFNTHLNFFLIFESLLLSGVMNVVLSSRPSFGKLVLLGMTLFGLFLALFWLCVQYNQGYLFEKLKKRLQDELPEYQHTLKERKEGRTKLLTLLECLTNLKVLAVGIPSLVALVWIGLFVYILFN